MAYAWLLVPDFLLIACGFVICRRTPLGRNVWGAVERLVYYLLFPVLLFNAIVRVPLRPAQAAPLAVTAVASVALAVVLALALGRWPGIDSRLHASGAQVAFRFNSFVALALAERLQGAQGLAWMALVVALCVPLCNIAAVWPLARHGGHDFRRELLRNPLIVSTLAGLACNLAGVQFPSVVQTTMQRIGGAALPLGLMAAGAGLQLSGLMAGPGLAAALLAIRHVAMPATALGLALAFALPPEQRQLVTLYAALPTASSAYVLAARMGGNGGYVAGLVTVSTLLGMLSIPFWLALASTL